MSASPHTTAPDATPAHARPGADTEKLDAPGTSIAPFDPIEAPAPKGAARALLRTVLGPDRRRLCLTVLLVLLQQAAALAGPLLIAVTINWAIPALTRGDATPLVVVAVGYALCVVAASVLQNLFVRLSVELGQNVLAELRSRLFRHIQAQDIEFHESHAAGAVTSRATGDVEAVRELFEGGISQIVTAGVSLVYISAIVLALDWQLSVAALAAMLPISWTMRVFRKRSLPVYQRRSAATAAVAGDMNETFAGIRTVQAFSRENANDQRFAVLNRHHRVENRQAGLEMARYVTSSRLVANTAVAGLVLWGGYRVASGALELGSFAGVALYLRDLYDSPLQLGGVLDTYQSAIASLEKIAVLLSIEPSVLEPERPTPLPALAENSVGRRVSYEDVTFAYHGGSEVLSRFELEIPAGETVALIGTSGSGKSTLAKLLARLHDPTSGRILLDGVDLRSVSHDELRKAMVMVPQEGFLFSGTVAENIAHGRPDASPEEIRRASVAAGTHQFINELQDGYQADVGSRGNRFSVGQRQLIALARVFLMNPSIIVLDEATSAIDIPTERALHTSMRAVLHGRTAMIIAHRLSTLQIADRVLVLADGRIVEDCTPADFLADPRRWAQANRP